MAAKPKATTPKRKVPPRKAPARTAVASRARTVVQSTRADLERLRERAPELADGALAASALVLARQLDDPRTSATSKSMCAKALREVIDRLFELAPPAREEDQLDRLRAQREQRRRRAAS
jgi:hypothetical protein